MFDPALSLQEPTTDGPLREIKSGCLASQVKPALARPDKRETHAFHTRFFAGSACRNSGEPAGHMVRFTSAIASRGIPNGHTTAHGKP
jgi:hypothetical protein